MKSKCGLKARKDDIPKHVKGEKTWVCNVVGCDVVMFGKRKPPCQFDSQRDIQRRIDEHEAQP